MNRTFRLVWNAALDARVPAPEMARGRGKRSRSRTAALLLSAAAFNAHALPTDGQVSAGQGSIARSGDTLTVTQTSAKLAVNWNSFNIAQGETVNFQQPDSSAIALNRVLGSDASAIYGHLNANGRVFLLNPNGMLFGPTAQVNVGGLVASTLGLSDDNFLAGKYTFQGQGGSVVNQGSITAQSGGYVALLGGQVSNEGTISARLGTVGLAAGDQVTLDFAGDQLLNLQVDRGTLNALAQNRQLIDAEGGTVTLTAKAVDQLMSAVVNNEGIVQAASVSQHNGLIRLEGDLVVNVGTLDASGAQAGGQIALTGRSLLQAGSIRADGGSGGDSTGGTIALQASGAVIQTAAGRISANAGGQAGRIDIAGGEAVFVSGEISASGGAGGRVTVTAPELTLAAASVRADGDSTGGTVLIGGDVHGGNPEIANAQRTRVNPFTSLSAQGQGGKIVVWSDGTTDFSGQAETGPAGFIEVSGKDTLNYAGQVNAGAGGQVLFDPTHLVIDDSAPAEFYFDLADPNPAPNDQHGSGGATALENGNIVVASPNDGFGGAAAGAAYLYDGQTGAMISALTGSTAGGQVGSGGSTALGNGNYVVRSQSWNNGAVTLAGAVTWGSGTTGVSGVVSEGNSLVGSQGSDRVGFGGITVLGNGNYMVNSYYWGSSAGAATWGSGTTGVKGVVSASNSLVGGVPLDRVGESSTALGNGNYVVCSRFWSGQAGAVTWGSGTVGVSGVVSASNSLIGSTPNDRVGESVKALGNGNYVVSSPNWDGAAADVGAVTWGSGTAGVSGVVSASNSLVGSTASDYAGSTGIIALSNGNYVVSSRNWDGAAANVGAVTWGDGTTGVSGIISASNSLVGSTANDLVGVSGIIALSNGNYVVKSSYWSNSAGAVTWGSGTTGVSGVVSAANSLVGSTAGDQVGGEGITVLSNGNYVVPSSAWDSPTAIDAGAVTWGDGTTGVSGIISASNSLVGSTAYDLVGMGNESATNKITVLSNGNYVVNSSFWNNGSALPLAGAVTWGSGTTGVKGVVSESNSLVGSSSGNQVGAKGVTALSNGNYAVSSPNWDGAAADVGAVTWGSGTTGVSGAVSASNSLVGSTAGDRVGWGGSTALSNGNYVVLSPAWDGAATDVGAVTWGDGTTGVKGVVSASNSLVGSSAFDVVGGGRAPSGSSATATTWCAAYPGTTARRPMPGP